MANRSFNRAQNLEKEIKSIFAEIAIGSSGAPTLTRGTGVASISRTSAGLYVLTLQDSYIRLMQASISIMAATAEDIVPQLVSETVSSTKTLTFRTNTDDVETDPADGDKIFIRLDLKTAQLFNL